MIVGRVTGFNTSPRQAPCAPLSTVRACSVWDGPPTGASPPSSSDEGAFRVSTSWTPDRVARRPPVPSCVSIESAHALCGPIALPTTFDAAQGHLARIGDSLTQIAQLEASAQSSYRVASLAPDLAHRRQRGASPGVLQGPLCHVLRLRLPIYSAPPSGPDQVGLGPLPLNTTW